MMLSAISHHYTKTHLTSHSTCWISAVDLGNSRIAPMYRYMCNLHIFNKLNIAPSLFVTCCMWVVYRMSGNSVSEVIIGENVLHYLMTFD